MNIINTNKVYKSSNRLLYSCQYHVIWCPKYRRKVLTPLIQDRFKSIVLEHQIEYEYSIIEQEVMLDHVHLLIDVNPKIGIYKVVSLIKGITSRILREEFPELKSKLPTLWTNSKFISSVGSISLETVKKYIENQKNV